MEYLMMLFFRLADYFFASQDSRHIEQTRISTMHSFFDICVLHTLLKVTASFSKI